MSGRGKNYSAGGLAEGVAGIAAGADGISGTVSAKTALAADFRIEAASAAATDLAAAAAVVTVTEAASVAVAVAVAIAAAVPAEPLAVAVLAAEAGAAFPRRLSAQAGALLTSTTPRKAVAPLFETMAAAWSWCTVWRPAGRDARRGWKA